MPIQMKNVTKETINSNREDFVGYFSLKKNHDKARVRFLYRGVDDVMGYYVHKLTFRNGKFRYVECLLSDPYNDPVEGCPICAAKNDESKVMQKMWLPLWDIDKKCFLFWDRGSSFWTDILLPLMQEFNDGDFCSHVFEVERFGEPGDQETTYEVVEIGKDETKIEDFFGVPNPAEKINLTRSYEELANYVATGRLSAPQAESAQAQQAPEASFPVRRRGTDGPIPPRRGTTRPNLV